MDIFQRRLLGAKKPQDIVLPKGYKRVSYLESVDGAYIDLNLDSYNNYPSFKFKIYVAEDQLSTDNLYVLGNNQVSLRLYKLAGVVILYGYYNGFNGYHRTYTADSWHDVEFGCGRIVLDGVEKTFAQYSKNSLNSIYLFKSNTNAEHNKNVKYGDLQAFTGKDNPTIARNLICCVRESDGEGGYWDANNSVCPITSTPFYCNAGSGHFIAGDEI